ncbi:DUF4870 domain-containing protein [Flavobacteriaceae bacterium]|nr:DUF4870 domain-containing protein [Flavobacteriaceae bacterium]
MILDTKTERILAIILHMSGFLNGVLPLAIPGIIWYWKREESTFINMHGKEAINFQLSILLLIIGATTFVVLTIGIGALIIAPLVVIFGLLYIYWIVMAAIAASKGNYYQYPVVYRFLK